jgi:ATP-dependent DNA helicase RecG
MFSALFLPGGDVVVVEVAPPIYLLCVIKDGMIRVGPRKAVANEQEERVLSERRVSSVRNFDATVCLEANISDLS